MPPDNLGGMSDTTGIEDIPEYEDTDLVAAEGLLREPAFWFFHLMATLGDLDADPEEYGVDAAAYEAMTERLGDADQPWPVIRVPFGGGHTALVVYANYEDENDIEFRVRHPAWGRVGYLADFGPECTGPGLSWAELTTIADSVPLGASQDEGLLDPAQRLLVLLPALGDAATPQDAWSIVARALVSCGISEAVADSFAQELVGAGPDASGFEPRWTVGADSPLPLCSSDLSPRRVPLALGITADQAQALAAALRGVPASNTAR